MPYRAGSGWNDTTELKCFLIMKKLARKNFPYRMQANLCKELADELNNHPPYNSLSAKVGNYKSVAKRNKPSNYSESTKTLHDKYENYSVQKLEIAISEMPAN